MITRINSECFDSIREDCGRRIRQIVGNIAEQLVEHTPVETGRARGHWRLSLNTAEPATSDSPDTEGTATVAEMLAALEPFQLGQTVCICNNAPYIVMLENGYSPQAPGGIVTAVVRDIPEFRNGGTP